MLPLCPMDLRTEMDESNPVRCRTNRCELEIQTLAYSLTYIVMLLETETKLGCTSQGFCNDLLALPGGRLISLNKTSLEGVTFSEAATILQNSPEEVELIVSQPKCKICSMHHLCLHSLRSSVMQILINPCQNLAMYNIDTTVQSICVLVSFM